MKLELIKKLSTFIITKNLTQREAAKLFGVTQPRISDLIQRKVILFSMDTLIDFLIKAGFFVRVDIQIPAKSSTLASLR